MPNIQDFFRVTGRGDICVHFMNGATRWLLRRRPARKISSILEPLSDSEHSEHIISEHSEHTPLSNASWPISEMNSASYQSRYDWEIQCSDFDKIDCRSQNFVSNIVQNVWTCLNIVLNTCSDILNTCSDFLNMCSEMFRMSEHNVQNHSKFGNWASAVNAGCDHR